MLACAQSLPLEPPHESGANITGAFEGWFKNPDGSFNLLLGYFNRNTKQELDVPIGPNNRIEPGGPDRGQPTHFLAGRQWGMFVVKVPSDFGSNKADLDDHGQRQDRHDPCQPASGLRDLSAKGRGAWAILRRCCDSIRRALPCKVHKA